MVQFFHHRRQHRNIEAPIYESPNKWCNSFFIEQHQISVHIYLSELNLHKTLSIIFKSWGISSSIIHIAISQES